MTSDKQLCGWPLSVRCIGLSGSLNIVLDIVSIPTPTISTGGTLVFFSKRYSNGYYDDDQHYDSGYDKANLFLE